jgi:glycosyltransferase involved in cell wall biosynthesis
MKKILVVGPILSRSGYGEMARFALRALKKHQDKFDIYVHVINWGRTGYIFEENEEYEWIKNLRIRTEQYMSMKGMFDISLQITIPNEWKRIAPVNIGYTAGIETNMISPAWLEPSNQMDKIVVISEHAKSSFINTIFGDERGNQFKVNTPVEVVHFPFAERAKEDLDLQLTTDFNFLCVNQWGPRKNIETLISSFIEEFREENVGLILKTNTANDSIMDKFSVEARLQNILSQKGDKKCKIYLLHGSLSDGQMQSLYVNPKIKAFITTTYGEGFGIPMFEAVSNGLPVIATDWSGHLDFLSIPSEQNKPKKMFAKIDFELKQIAQEHVWGGVMEAQSSWAYVNQRSVRDRMREVYKDLPRFKSWSLKLAEYNKEMFQEDKIYDKFINIFGPVEDKEDELVFL